MPNKYTCSDGSKVTEASIKSKLSQAYKSWYAGEGPQSCHGCGKRAEGTAHIIPKARCKQLRLTDLIWKRNNTFPSCHRCNMIAENPESDAIKELNNYVTILEVTEKYDYERYQKMIL